MLGKSVQSSNEINGPDLLRLYCLARALDGVFWSLLVFYVVLITTFRDLMFVTFPFLLCVPLFVLSYASFKLPLDFLHHSTWRENIQTFKIFSLVSTFNFPFIVFLARGETKSYFIVCSMIAVYGFVRVLTSIVLIAKQLGRLYDEPDLVKEGNIAVVLLYFVAVLGLAYLFLALTNPVLLSSLLHNILSEGNMVKIFVLVVLVFPFLLPITLLFRSKSLITINTKEKMRKY